MKLNIMPLEAIFVLIYLDHQDYQCSAQISRVEVTLVICAVGFMVTGRGESRATGLPWNFRKERNI
jgi:hypothetical protein